MEFKNPRRKRQCNLELQQPFPIFIESEIGISIDNWVPIICTGIFNGFGVVVKEPAEISALHNMGNFGKGSNSRSRPYIMRNNSKLPLLLRKRQYLHRKMWMDKAKAEHVNHSEASTLLEEILKLQASIKRPRGECQDKNESVNRDTTSKNKSEIIDILSSDEENMTLQSQNVSSNSNEMDISQNNTSIEVVDNINEDEQSKISKDLETEEKSIHDLNFPLDSVIVLPDSDSETDDYFKDLNPKLYIDKSNLQENLVLTFQEAYFLAYGLGCLQILDDFGRPLSLDETWHLFCKTQHDFCSKYIVYHYYRSKGWVVKPGIKFGGDFLLYKEGQPFYHANYIVLVEVIHSQKSSHPQQKFDWKTIFGIIRMAGTAAKEVIVAQVIVPDRESMDTLCENPENVKKFKVLEVLLRRWISKQERADFEED